MRCLKNLLGIGVTAGATVAAMKVAQTCRENNPGGVQDSNGDGRVDAKDVLAKVAKSATEVYSGAAAAIREKGPVYAWKAKAAVDDTFGTGE